VRRALRTAIGGCGASKTVGRKDSDGGAEHELESTISAGPLTAGACVWTSSISTWGPASLGAGAFGEGGNRTFRRARSRRTREGKPSRFASRWRQAGNIAPLVPCRVWTSSFSTWVRLPWAPEPLAAKAAAGRSAALGARRTREGKPSRFASRWRQAGKTLLRSCPAALAVGPRVVETPCDQQAAFLVTRKMRVTYRGTSATGAAQRFS
jgi:hypothetical protein